MPTPTPRQLPSLWPDFGFFDPTSPGASFAQIIGTFLNLIFIIGGFTAFILIVMGAFGIISSGGDQQKLADGRSKITWAIIGLIILLATWAIMTVIERVTGLCIGISCPIDLNTLSSPS